MKILIVDDEPIVRRSLWRAAEKRGHQTAEAKDGWEAIEVWQKFAPDLVFLDVLMPGLSGPDVIQRMDGRTHAKILLMSAYSGEYNIDQIPNRGVDRFLKKPFNDILEIITAAEELVGR